jgi:hypothetical protein
VAASKVNKGWSSVTVGGTTVAHVNSVSFGKAGNLLPYMGDAAVLPTIIAVRDSHPHGTVVTADIATAQGFEVGAAGTIVATTPDALGATGGNITYTLANGKVQNVDVQGQWGAFGQATISVLGASSDGTTPPLSVTLA